MGNSLTMIISHGRRLMNRYNAQYRALKFLEKENRSSAPRHASSRISEEVKGNLKLRDICAKDEKLGKYLKDIYVRSLDDEIQPSQAKYNDPARPLPESRNYKFVEAFSDPDEIEKGYCTIKQISTFLAKYEEDPVENNVHAIAKEYSLDEKKVENIVNYFVVFNIHDAVAASLPKERPQRVSSRLLDAGSNEENSEVTPGKHGGNKEINQQLKKSVAKQ